MNGHPINELTTSHCPECNGCTTSWVWEPERLLVAKMHLVLVPVILDQTGSDTNHSSYSRIAAYLRNQIFSVTYNA